MELPSLTDPDGLFDYLIALILLLALLFGLYWGAIYFELVEPIFFGSTAPAI